MSVIKIPVSRKIMVVNVGNNQLANDIFATLKDGDFSNVIMIDKPNSYADYYKMSEEKPAYTLFVEESKSCRVKHTKVEGLKGDRLGHLVRRNADESLKAKNYYKHYLKMIGITPAMTGAEEIPFDIVRDIEWFYEDGTPMIYLEVPNAEGVSQSVCDAIKDYFRK